MSLPAATLERLRASAPLVHNVTNYVAMDVTANALLAVGASPLMAHALEEVDDIVGIAHALAVNIGTLSPTWVAGMHRAAARAAALGTPWVLDPVGVGATSYRTGTARALLDHRPTAVRGNASEILALAGAAVGATRGVDSAHASTEARDAAAALARALGCVVAVTGAVDYVTDGRRTLAVANGDALMARVTALGCTATAVVAACLAAGGMGDGDPVAPLEATAHALAVMGVAGELAARSARGPGSFRVAFVDALHELTGETLDAMARIDEVPTAPG